MASLAEEGMGKPRWVRVVAVLSCMPKAVGNLDHQLEMLVCLTPEARLDTHSAHAQPYRARQWIKRQEAWSGFLVFEEEIWALHSDNGDDPIWFIKVNRLRPGEYLTLYRPDQAMLTFQVIKVDHLQDPGYFSESGAEPA